MVVSMVRSLLMIFDLRITAFLLFKGIVLGFVYLLIRFIQGLFSISIGVLIIRASRRSLKNTVYLL